MAESEYITTPRPRRKKPSAEPGPYRYMSWGLAEVLANSALAYCKERCVEIDIPRRAGCLYVMTAGDFMKVGVTFNPQQRLSDLQCGNPLLIELRKVYLPPADINIIRIEQIVHQALAAFHVRGEWFLIEGLSLFEADPSGGV